MDSAYLDIYLNFLFHTKCTDMNQHQCDALNKCVMSPHRQTTVLQRHVRMTFKNTTVQILTSNMALDEWLKFFSVWMKQKLMV